MIIPPAVPSDGDHYPKGLRSPAGCVELKTALRLCGNERERAALARRLDGLVRPGNATLHT
ncbi:hypothetical protein [Lentzea kentuckyensis]|uniref:hypothetical protein n=1 Tax=Lentzea kentuckyensis TaxID=360086 RepID=UPI00117AE144|nr:hypothetical protein [Lentzea kentuckyensis]